MVQRGEISRPCFDVVSLDSTEVHGLVWAAAIRYQRSVVLAVVDAGAPLQRPLGGSGGLIVRGAWGACTGASPVDATAKGADKVSLPGTLVPTCLARAANALPLQNELHWEHAVLPVWRYLGRSLLSAQTVNGLCHQSGIGAMDRLKALSVDNTGRKVSPSRYSDIDSFLGRSHCQISLPTRWSTDLSSTIHQDRLV